MGWWVGWWLGSSKTNIRALVMLGGSKVEGSAEGIAMPELDSDDKATFYKQVMVLIREMIDDDAGLEQEAEIRRQPARGL